MNATMAWRGVATAGCLLVLGGCAKLDSIYRRPDLTSDRSIVTDAKQRVVTNIPVHKPRFLGRIDPDRVVCAEPSPDVAQAISQSVSAQIQAAIQKGAVSGQGAASAALAAAESIVQLGERLATIQLLRDKFYRACEAYANGALSATNYTIMMSRLDRTMTTMMLGEMAAGAFGRTLAAAGGAAQASAAPATEDVEKAKKAVTDARMEVATEEQEVEKKKQALAEKQEAAKNDPAKKPEAELAQKAYDDEQKKLNSARQKLTTAQQDLLTRVTTAIASASPALGIGTIAHAPAPSQAVSDAVIRLQQQYLDVGDFSTLLDACVTSMDVINLPTSEKLQRYSEAMKTIEAYDQQTLALQKTKPDETSAKQRVQQRQALLREMQKIESEVSPLSELGRWCRTVTIQDVWAALKTQIQISQARANAELERTRIELCRTAAISSDQKVREAAIECAKSLTQKPSPSEKPQEGAPGKSPGKN